MGIGSVTSMNSMSGMRTITAGSAEPKSKRIQNEIINVQQQMQNLSSKEDLSVNEKTNEREKLQKELSSLNTELKQYQEEFRKSQRREIMMAELQEDKETAKDEKPEAKTQTEEKSLDNADEKNLPADGQHTDRQGVVVFRDSDGVVILKDGLNQNEESDVNNDKKQTDESKEDIAAKKPDNVDNAAAKDASLSHKEIHAMVSAGSSVQQANRLGTIIANTSDGIAILKSEIDRDEERGIDTERKRADLEKMEKAEQRTIAFQSSILGEANSAMKSAATTNAVGIKDGTQINVENAFINAMKVSQEEQVSQQKFNVSFF